jgi:predicted DNA-binding transcriptional regulator AlpA
MASVKAGGDLVPGAATSPKALTPGVSLDAQERLKAADLRTALLMGKIPEDAGLLIDTKMAARLLNVSARTLYRLHQLGATPDPVRIGGKIIRFRLAELLAWIEADCPPKKHWSYSPDSMQKKGRK